MIISSILNFRNLIHEKIAHITEVLLKDEYESYMDYNFNCFNNLGYSKDCLIIVGLNLTGILGNAEADPQGLVGGEDLGPPGTDLARGLGPLPRNKNEFFAWNGILVSSERYFLNIWGNNLH